MGDNLHGVQLKTSKPICDRLIYLWICGCQSDARRKSSVCVSKQPIIPWTNNKTQQAIGRIEMRSCTVRGYKSWQGMLAAFLLTGSDVMW